MSDQNSIEFPSKGIGRKIKETRNRKIQRLNVSVSDDTTVFDAPVVFDLRIIPKVFTAPLEAIGGVTSIFARMTGTRISLQLEDDQE